MAVNLIVIAVTLLMSAFALFWWLRPDWRPWIEAPKYRVLSWDREPPVNENRDQEPSDTLRP